MRSLVSRYQSSLPKIYREEMKSYGIVLFHLAEICLQIEWRAVPITSSLLVANENGLRTIVKLQTLDENFKPS